MTNTTKTMREIKATCRAVALEMGLKARSIRATLVDPKNGNSPCFFVSINTEFKVSRKKVWTRLCQEFPQYTGMDIISCA